MDASTACRKAKGPGAGWGTAQFPVGPLVGRAASHSKRCHPFDLGVGPIKVFDLHTAKELVPGIMPKAEAIAGPLGASKSSPDVGGLSQAV